MSLRDLKVGDEVFVVNQKRRHGGARSTTNAKIVRVGRKYAYIKPYGYAELPFCRESGCSVHTDDSNARVNGFGLDDSERRRSEQSIPSSDGVAL